MKIETTIKPRKDGKVTVEADDGEKYVFKRDESGALTCDVPNESHVAWLLGLGDFHPADESDFGLAMQLTDGEQSDEGEDPADDDDEQPDMNAAPIEEPASQVASPGAPRVAKPRTAKKAD